ncbi:MAG: type II secretion system protein, partial [Gemmatimonadetes bacterium]|nr:type II secretion system protein [Gemmatimonadota bacterium]
MAAAGVPPRARPRRLRHAGDLRRSRRHDSQPEPVKAGATQGGGTRVRAREPPLADRRAHTGFTLIEIVVALAILGLVTSTVYLALGGAMTSAERVKEAQKPYQRGRVARSFLASALRSSAPFTGVPGDG